MVSCQKREKKVLEVMAQIQCSDLIMAHIDNNQEGIIEWGSKLTPQKWKTPTFTLNQMGNWHHQGYDQSHITYQRCLQFCKKL